MKLFLSSSRQDRSFAELLGQNMRALGAEVMSDETLNGPGVNWDHAFRAALEASDGFVLIMPEPGTARANNAFFEAGAARALGKRIVAVMPSADAARARELPADMYGLAVFDGSNADPDTLAKAIVSTLKAA
jgi:hypothetical protein